MPRFTKKISGPSDKTLIERFDQVVPRADRARARVIESIASVEKTRRSGLARERARLAFKHGERSAEVARAERKLEAQDRAIVTLDGEVERVRIGPVIADPHAAIIHGRVLNQKKQGMPGLVVQVVDPNGRALARSKTDERGYFKLESSGAGDATAAEVTSPASVILPLARERQPVGGAAPAAPGRAKARLTVLAGDRELHREDVRPISPGETRYQEIVIKSGR